MAKNNSSGEKATIYTIPFQDKEYRLTRDWLDQYIEPGSRNNDDWRWPTLKFLSFQQNRLALLNTSEDRSYHLTLQVKDKNLLVSCSCGNNKSTLCEHAYAGLYTLIWHLGECYFAKLQAGGAIELAFAHKSHFDKKESTAGIDVFPRPELKSVFHLDTEVAHINLTAILQLPAETKKVEVSKPEEVLSYLIIIPFRNKLLPALMPCRGKLNKNRTEVKTWEQFLSGVQKQFYKILTEGQKELNSVCFHLWKTVEKTSGYIVSDADKKETNTHLLDIFNSWKRIIPLLQKQPFVYTYLFYGVRELRKRPAKQRIQKIIVSEQVPQIAFVLLEKKAFWEFYMQVRINEKLLSDFEADATFFIRHQGAIYMLPSLRDAALAEWIYQSGGRITVFKEHYARFESDVLIPLRESYTVEIKARKNNKIRK